jgi:hypothetical protein
MAKGKKAKECDCISKVAEKIKTKIAADKAKSENGYKLLGGEWEHHSWHPNNRLYSNYVIESTFQKKDGSASRPKKDSISIFYSYCPFCGKQFPK